MTNDEKWFEKKMDRREFLKKAGIGGAGLALGVSGASAFFANKAQEEKKISDGGEEISFYGEHQAGITTPMQKNIYLVVNWWMENWSKKMVLMPFCLLATLVKQWV